MKKQKFSENNYLSYINKKKTIKTKEVRKRKGIRKYNCNCHHGRTLMEVIITLGISVLITMMIVNIYVTSIKNYNEGQKYDSETIAMYEALIYIDYYVNYDGENYYVQDSKLYVEGKYGERKNYIFLKDNEIRVAYKNGSGNGYTSQPLMYEVSEFNLAENENVIFIEIVTIEGNRVKKAIGRM